MYAITAPPIIYRWGGFYLSPGHSGQVFPVIFIPDNWVKDGKFSFKPLPTFSVLNLSLYCVR